MQIVPFREGYFSSLHTAFNKAFSDYSVSFNLSAEELRIRLLEKSQIDSELSLLMANEGEVLGFALHSKSEFRGRLFAYNAGTGVLPQRRSQGIATRLLEASLTLCDKHGLPCLLEVLEDNERALKLYERMGFKPIRFFRCFKIVSPSFEPTDEVSINIVHNWNLNRYKDLRTFDPSFIDSDSMIYCNRKNEVLLEAVRNNEVLGYLILQPHLGRISQFAVGVENRGKKVGSSLLHSASKLCVKDALSIINIPEEESQTIDSLLALGFKNEINQFEMVREPLDGRQAINQARNSQ